MPVANIETVADPHWMMAAVRGTFPGRLLATRSPLPRHPPAADLLGMRRFLEIDDRNNVAEIAIQFRRAIDVATIESEAMHAAGGPGRDPFRLGRFADVEDLKAAMEIGIIAADRIYLAVDQHDVMFDTDFMRQRTFRHLDACEFAWLGRIGDVDD